MQRSLGILAGVAAAGLVVWLILIAPAAGDRRLNASVMGADGLRHWLESQGVPVTRSNPRLTPLREDLSLALLPLYDTDLYDTAPAPQTDEARMAQTSPREAPGWLVEDMAEKLPTLIVLPKWRTGFALTGIAHEQTQIPPAEVQALIGQTGLAATRLVPVVNGITGGEMSLRSPGDAAPAAPRPPPGDGERDEIDGPAAPQGGSILPAAPEAVARPPGESVVPVPPAAPERGPAVPGPAHRIALFRAQLLDRASLPPDCAELAGLPAGALVVHCAGHEDMPGATYLSDPDLLNNHGLRLAGNAAFATALVEALRNGDLRPVLLATEPVYIRTGGEQPEPHERTGEDLARFFAWPLSAMWAMGGLVLALALWRGARRFGPARGPQDRTEASSRRAAIAAKARLLRLSGADARMAAEHVHSHLADLAVQTLGPGAGNDPGIARWFALTARRNPELADEIRATARRITSDTPPADLPRLIQTLHALTRKAQDAA